MAKGSPKSQGSIDPPPGTTFLFITPSAEVIILCLRHGPGCCGNDPVPNRRLELQSSSEQQEDKNHVFILTAFLRSMSGKLKWGGGVIREPE